MQNFEEIIAGLLLFLVLMMVCAEIIARSVIGESLIWPDEISRVLFVWATFIGSGAALKKAQLVSIDAIYKSVSTRVKMIMDVLSFLVILTVLLFLGYTGLLFMFKYKVDIMPMTGLPLGYLYSSVPVGSALMIIRLIQKYANKLQQYISGEAEPQSGS